MKIPAFGVEEWLNENENKAIYDIAGSSIESFSLKEIIEINGDSFINFFKKLENTKMNYGSIEGSYEFKKEISLLYKNTPPENILQTNGATGANLLALYALIEPKDHVIALYPSYQQLYDIPKSFGADVDYWRIDEKNNWMPHINELKKLIKPNTKMICLNNANNPTGAVFEETFLKEVVSLADAVGAYILVDEVYTPLDSSVKFTSIVDLYHKGISTNSISKTYSVPGIRIGWTASNSETANTFRKYRDYTMICAGVIDDAIAVHVMKNKQAILKRNKNLVLNNLKILIDWVNSEPRVSLVPPRMVSTSFIKLDIPLEIEEFCINLLDKYGVLLVPGNRFDMPGYARLGYCTSTKTLKNGLELLSKYLKTFDK